MEVIFFFSQNRVFPCFPQSFPICRKVPLSLVPGNQSPQRSAWVRSWLGTVGGWKAMDLWSTAGGEALDGSAVPQIAGILQCFLGFQIKNPAGLNVVYLSIYLSTYLSIDLSIYLSIDLSIYLIWSDLIWSDPIRSDPIRSDPIRSDPILSYPIYLSIYLSIYISIYLSNLSIYTLYVKCDIDEDGLHMLKYWTSSTGWLFLGGHEIGA